MGNFKDQMFGKSRLAVTAKINLISLTDQDKMVLFAAKGVIGFVDLIHSDKVKAFAFQFIARIGNGLIGLRGKADRERALWALSTRARMSGLRISSSMTDSASFLIFDAAV